MHNFNKISVIGLGYIGLPTAAMFALQKIEVIGVDVTRSIVDTINRGEIHIVEPDLDSAVRAAVSEGYLKATVSAEPAQAFLIAVPTPFKGTNHDPDISYIKAACQTIAPVLEPGNLVVLESTSPVGTTEQLAEWLAKARPDLTFPQTHNDASDIRIAYCPERVLPGKIMQELVSNDRVIGGMTRACSDAAIRLYQTFVQGNCVITNARTAEMTKLTENSFRDVNIAFANELSVICDKLDISVWELIALANRHPRVNILQPGPGVGGHCIAVDPWFIVSRTPEQARIIRTAREVNDAKPDWVIEKVNSAIGEHLLANPTQCAGDVTLACYGLTFKPDVDDLRESPALEIVRKLAKHHAGRLLTVEPNITALPAGLGEIEKVEIAVAKAEGDIHILLVDHNQFKATSAPDGLIVDVRGVWG